MAHIASLPLKALSTFGRAVVMAALATAVLVSGPVSTVQAFNGPVPTAQAFTRVDFNMEAVADGTFVNRGGPVILNMHIGRNGPPTDAGRVQLVLNRDFSNVRVTRSDRFACTVKADFFFNTPVWNIICTKPMIAAEQYIQVKATAPNKAQTTDFFGGVRPVNAQDVNLDNNNALTTIYVR